MLRVTFLIAASAIAVAQTPLPESIDNATPAEVQMRLIEDAAPSDVVKNASIYILGRDGYQLQRKGPNGFSCLISREFRETLEPECYDAEGSATLLAAALFVERERAKGTVDDVIRKAVAARYKAGEFKAPRKPGIVYMLSPHNRVFDPGANKIISFPGHLMFYAPYATEKTVGSGPGAPYLVHPGEPDTLMIVVPVAAHQH